MIALRKLERLGTTNRLRKCAELFRSFEEEIRRKRPVDGFYLAGLCECLYRTDTEDRLREDAGRLAEELRTGALSLSMEADAELGRRCGALYAALLGALGTSPAEWDFRSDGSGDLDPAARQIIPLDLYLEDIRSPFNVGALFRSADAFGVRRIFLSPACPYPLQPRAKRSAMGTVDLIPWEIATLDEALTAARNGGEQKNYRIVALETGGSAIGDYRFPEAGLLIVGNEEWGVSDRALAAADSVLSIPIGGAKASINVSVASGIAMQRWFEAEKNRR